MMRRRDAEIVYYATQVMAIDHVWAGRGLAAGECRLGWSGLSDHRAAVADVGE